MFGDQANQTVANLEHTVGEHLCNALVIGDVSVWRAQGRLPGETEGIDFIEFSQLDAGLLIDLQIDMVLTPLFCSHFDTIDVAIKLRKIGYRGRYRVIADSIPDAKLVRREIHEIAPDLDFDILVLGGDAAIPETQVTGAEAQI